MAPLSQCLVLSLAASAAAFSPAGTATTRPTSAVPKTVAFESFGFDFAEDQAENSPPQLLGEARYKQWVGEQNDNSFLNRQVRFKFCAWFCFKEYMHTLCAFLCIRPPAPAVPNRTQVQGPAPTDRLQPNLQPEMIR